jgi:hypothetical protein
MFFSIVLTSPNDLIVLTQLPDPVDNDFRGNDRDHTDSTHPYYEDNITASKFSQDAPVFAVLSDGSHAIHDYCLLLESNTIENPLLDGRGATVLAASPTRTNDMVSFRSMRICAN